MKWFFSRHVGFWTRRRLGSFGLSFALLVLSLLVQMSAGAASARRALSSSAVHDIILDNIPVVDLSFVIVQGALIFALGFIATGIIRPRYLIFGMKATALLVLTRAVFINLTNLGIHPNELFLGAMASASYSLYQLVDFPGNYFFSGHTALPLLAALIVWQERPWRLAFLAASVFFGASVLLAHIHYSIDVFAAPFIAYGVYRVAAKLFPADYALAVEEAAV
ncbi:MAG: phosphatase PAP2-related protein [Patescibacteria group bacterium]